MPYEVTATRKRPHDFDHLTGQDFVVSTLKNAVHEGKIAHAYLFSGPRGVGKTSAARILAKAVNCEQGPTATPCGECSNCQEITNGRSMDVIEIDGASNTSVNDIREIKDEVLFSPTNSRYKVYIIDEVHMLSNSAFNALLKTIEEPPPYIIFIFATTEIHKVPATIRSRCQQFNFRLISMDLIKNRLEQICEERGIQYDADALYWIAKEAAGSLRDGYTLFDQIESFSENHITLKKIREKLGLIGLDHLNELAAAFIRNSREEALTLMDKALEQGISVEQFVVDLTEYYRNILFLKNGLCRENLLGYSPERFPAEVVEAFTTGQLEKALDMLFQVFKDIRFSVNPRFELELLISRLSGLSQFITNDELLERLEEMKQSLAAGLPEGQGESVGKDPSKSPSPGEDGAKKKAPFLTEGFKNRIADGKAAKQEAPPAEKPSEEEPKQASPFSLQNEIQPGGQEKSREKVPTAVGAGDQPKPDPGHLEKRIREGIKRAKPSLETLLRKAVSWEWEGAQLVISFANPFEINLVKKEQVLLNQKLTECVGESCTLKVQLKRDEEKPAVSQQGAEPPKDEVVDSFCRVFRGQVVQGN